ncbi:MAG: ASPIC/UnbV domain-containing protein [Balneolaceae bacterium]
MLENKSGTENNWLQVYLTGIESNRSAIGAKLRLITTEGIQIKQVGSQSSYLSQNTLVQHFGLKDVEVVDALEITWPGGRKEVFKNLPVNQRLNITEGDSGVIP